MQVMLIAESINQKNMETMIMMSHTGKVNSSKIVLSMILYGTPRIR